MQNAAFLTCIHWALQLLFHNHTILKLADIGPSEVYALPLGIVGRTQFLLIMEQGTALGMSINIAKLSQAPAG